MKGTLHGFQRIYAGPEEPTDGFELLASSHRE